MIIMNDFVLDIMKKIATQGGQLRKIKNRKTLQQEDIESAAKLILPTDLAKFALIDAKNALAKFTESK